MPTLGAVTKTRVHPLVQLPPFEDHLVMNKGGIILKTKLGASFLGLAIGVIGILGPASGAWAASGDLDGTFGTQGKVITNVTPELDLANAVAIQADGKILAAGHAGGNYFSGGDFGLVRYNSNGLLDGSFGNEGKVLTDFALSGDSAEAMAIQPDGRIVLAGWTFSDFKNFALARYLANGQLDTSFGVQGKVVTDFSGGQDLAYAVAVQPDGKIVAAGSSDSPSGRDFALARYNPDGSPDVLFGRGGRVTIDFGSVDSAEAVLIQPDGKIVAAGWALESDSCDSPETIEDFLGVCTAAAHGDAAALVRYNPDGSLDSTFGVGGKAIVEGDLVFGAALQPDGKIVVAGGLDSFLLRRHNADGSVDSTFGINGTAVDTFTAALAKAVAISPDGRILASGMTCSACVAHHPHARDDKTAFALARYLPDGSSDTSFGSGGKVTTNLGGNNGAESVALQSDGKIVAAGEADGRFGLIRVLGTSTPSAPTLSATAGDRLARLNWTVPPNGSSPITGYRIYRGTSSSPKTLRATVGTVTTFDDTQVINGTTYYYQVSAVNSVGEGPLSNEVSAMPKALPDTSPPAAPNLLSPSDGSTTSKPKPTFDWSDVTDPSGVTYQLQVDNSGTGFSSPEVNRTGLASSNFTPTSKLSKATYYWRVRATDGAGNAGAWSTIYRVTVR